MLHGADIGVQQKESGFQEEGTACPGVGGKDLASEGPVPQGQQGMTMW